MTPSTQAPGARLVPFELPAATGLLQPWADEDLDDLCDALQDRLIGAWNGSGSDSQQTAAQFLRDRQDWGSGNTRHGPSQPHTRALIGSISLHRVDGEQSSAEIGYWTAPAARGHGAATHAVVAVCHWAFDALQLERIELRHAVENTESDVPQSSALTDMLMEMRLPS